MAPPKKMASMAVQKLSAQRDLTIAKGQADALTVVANALVDIVQGHDYRKSLREMIAALQTDQTMRHEDVQLLSQLIDQHKDDMSHETKDEYFKVILKLLESRTARERLPQLPK